MASGGMWGISWDTRGPQEDPRHFTSAAWEPFGLPFGSLRGGSGPSGEGSGSLPDDCEVSGDVLLIQRGVCQKSDGKVPKCELQEPMFSISEVLHELVFHVTFNTHVVDGDIRKHSKSLVRVIKFKQVTYFVVSIIQYHQCLEVLYNYSQNCPVVQSSFVLLLRLEIEPKLVPK